MDKIQIETNHNIRISQNIASLTDRFFAHLLDITLQAIYVVIALSFLSNLLSYSSNMEIWATVLVIGLPVTFYHLIMESLNNGQSPGKMLLKIRVVQLDGSPARFSNYLLRWLLRSIDFGLTRGGCAVVVFLLKGKGQRLGDVVAKTTVISEKKTISLKDTFNVSLPSNYQPSYAQVTVLSDSDMQKIAALYKKAKAEKNAKLLTTLGNKTAELMQVQPKENYGEFLETVIQDYNFYTQ